MKAFKHLFRDVSAAEYAMAAAVIIAFMVFAAGAHSRSTAKSRLPTCCGLDRLQDYHGPRA